MEEHAAVLGHCLLLPVLTCKRWEPSSLVMLSRGLNLVDCPHPSPRPTDRKRHHRTVTETKDGSFVTESLTTLNFDPKYAVLPIIEQK